jgi:hypothetical protein
VYGHTYGKLKLCRPYFKVKRHAVHCRNWNGKDPLLLDTPALQNKWYSAHYHCLELSKQNTNSLSITGISAIAINAETATTTNFLVSQPS